MTVLANGIQIINDNNDNIYMCNVHCTRVVIAVCVCARVSFCFVSSFVCDDGKWFVNAKKQSDQFRRSDSSRSSYIVQAINENVMT